MSVCPGPSPRSTPARPLCRRSPEVHESLPPWEQASGSGGQDWGVCDPASPLWVGNAAHFPDGPKRWTSHRPQQWPQILTLMLASPPSSLPLSSLTPASWTPSHSAPKPLAQALHWGRCKLRPVPFNPGTLSQKKVKNQAPPFYTSYNFRFDVTHEPPYF